MADPRPYPDSGVEPDDGSPPRMPRWLKVSGITVLVVVLLVIGLMVLTGHEGQPGPGQHIPGGKSAGETEGRAPERGAPGAEGHRPPPGVPDH